MGTRAQCIVHKGNQLLMARHRQNGQEWWVLPGGGVEKGETPAQAALRELKEECCVDGIILKDLNGIMYSPNDKYANFLIDIGHQEPQRGYDPEFPNRDEGLMEIRWMSISEISERDRVYLWAAGLLCIDEFREEVSSWGDNISYPKS